jgi:hypothetical protein
MESSMTALSACIVMFWSCLVPWQGTGGNDLSRIKLTVVEPALGETLAPGIEAYVHVKLVIPEGVERPRWIYADFYRVKGNVISGQFNFDPDKLTRNSDGDYECKIKVSTPKATTGDYKLKISVHGKVKSLDDPTKTLELKRLKTGDWEIRKHVDVKN